MRNEMTELKKLLEEATPLPWYYSEKSNIWHNLTNNGCELIASCGNYHNRNTEIPTAIASLICYAVNNIQSREDEVKSLEAENEVLREQNFALNKTAVRADKAEAEVERLTECEEVASRANAELIKDNKGLQAIIDALMFEYCPDEMTEEQVINYELAQQALEPVNES